MGIGAAGRWGLLRVGQAFGGPDLLRWSSSVADGPRILVLGDRHQDEGDFIQITSRSLQVSMPIVSGSPILLVLLSQEAATRERAM